MIGKKSTFAAVFYSCLTVGAHAQAACPPGLTLIGEAYAEDSASNAEAKVQAVERVVKFPRYFKLDQTYVQHAGKWAGGSAGAVMSDADVPNGLHLVATGTEGGPKGWSVHSPKLRIIEEDGDRIVQRGLEIRLYCHSGSGAPDKLGHTSCNARVLVCAKERA